MAQNELIENLSGHKRWQIIRESYCQHAPAIYQHRLGRSDPYWLPWLEVFTPIERQAWNCIRGLGIPLYPQVPVLEYFVDFANPVLRIGLEVDGAQWHKDVAKDKQRDIRLMNQGWHIYRCTGAEAMRVITWQDEEDSAQAAMMESWYMTTVDGVLKAMGHVYGVWPMQDDIFDLCHRTLNAHRLAPFEIGRDENALS